PLERVTGVVNFYTLAGSKIARRDRGLSILRELAIELFPEVTVGRQVLSLFLPDELQRMPESQLVNNGRPVQLQHPQRVQRRLGCIGRLALAIANLPHGVA